MKRCPITYEIISAEETYSKHGLHLLSPQLKNLKPLEFSAAEQRKEAIARVGKMSIQGVQTKLSAQLKVKEEYFELVDQFGHYILKPQSEHYPELPQNEAVTMTMAWTVGLETPVHGLIYANDNSMTYFVKRFDRTGHNKKLAMEDFAQLSGFSRDTKYNSSMEKVINLISTYCSFPKIELVKLFKLTLFNYLVGNEDMHLKNFSLITRNQIVTLSPVYDLLNSTIALPQAEEEMALSLHGKKKNLKRADFLEYFAKERLGLNDITTNKVLTEITQAIPKWKILIENSFLSQEMKAKYLDLLTARAQHLGL